MKKIKKAGKRAVAFIMLVALTLGLAGGYLLKEINAADFVTVDKKSGYFFVRIQDDTTGKGETVQVNVSISGLSGPNNNRTGSNTAVSLSNPSDKRWGSGFNINVNSANSLKNLAKSGNGNYSIVVCALSFQVPAHTSYYSQEVGNNTAYGWCNACSKMSGDRTNPSFSVGLDTHKTAAGSMNFLAVVNLANTGINNSEGGERHSNIIIHIRRNSYSISYDLDGGKFENAYNSTHTDSDGSRQLQNPTSAHDGGEKDFGYTNSDMYIEYPTKTGYTFTGWNITGMDHDTHALWRPGTGWYTFTSDSLNTTTDATLKADAHIPHGYESLRKSAGTVTFHALYTANRYTVKYDGNGATSGVMPDQEMTYDTASNLKANTYVRPGYTFKGWSATPQASGLKYADTESVKNLTDQAGGNVTLYAVWQKKQTLLGGANVLKNVEKMFLVNIVKVDESDRTKNLSAEFDVYEWSAGKNAYKDTPSFQISSNKNVKFAYTSDNLGKFKIKEASVEEPYLNNGDEAEISMSDATDIPFYENSFDDADRGVYLKETGYEKGDIVRDNADVKNAAFYMAKTATTSHGTEDGAYWQKLSESNYGNYSALVKGAGKWDMKQTYAKTFSIEFTNGKKPETGLTFGLRKKNETGALLSGAEFNVYYEDDGSLERGMYGPVYNKGLYRTDFNKEGQQVNEDEDGYPQQIPVDDRQTHAVMNADGTKTLKMIVKEDSAPAGHKTIDDFKVTAHIVFNEIENKWKAETITAEFSDGTTQTIKDGGVFDTDALKDKTKKINLIIVKKADKGSYDTSDLAGAEYTVYEDAELTLPVTTVTIGKDGKGSAENLPVKDYFICETKAPKSGKFKLSDEVRHITPSDEEAAYTAIFTEEEESGKLIVYKIKEDGEELNGAGFTLYKAPLNITEENAADYEPDEALKVKTETVSEGYARFDGVPFGRYVLAETKVPQGYKKAVNRLIEITKENGGNSDATAKVVTVVNMEKKSGIRIYKEDADNGERLAGAVFKIFDMTNDTYLKEDVISFDEEGKEIQTSEDKLFMTDEDGLITAEDLRDGTYRIEEVKAPDGYLTDAKPVTITVKDGSEDGKDDNGVPYYSVTFTDKKTQTHVTKVDITTKKEIQGGEYVIEDENGNTIDHWMGEGTAHKVYGLIPGNKYFLIEEAAPLGYTVAEPVEFKVNTDGSITKVVMEDDYNKVEISKCDITTKEEIEGAELELYDSEGNLIESWVSEKEPHRIDRLPAGTYTLKETKAPDGYVISESITFEVGESNEVQEVAMYDDYTKTRFLKLASDTGEPLKGCVLQVLDKEKNVIDEWTSDGTAHEVYYLNAGETYYLHEVSAPSDYQVAEDIAFTAGEPWSDGNMITEEDYNRMDGTQYTDEGGNTVSFDDGKVGTTEPEDDSINAPEEESGEEDSEVTKGDTEEASVEDEDILEDTYDDSAADMVTVTMLDQPKLVAILKKTDAGDLLEGAELELIEDASGKVIHSWTSHANVESVFRLKNGKYTIHEKYAPENFALADDIHFEVTDDTTQAEYEMTDEYTGGSIKVVKLDEATGKPLEGVEFTLTGEDGLKLTQKTDENGEICFGVKDGKSILPPQKYTLAESHADKGYALLKEPVTVTLPMKLTKAEAEAKKADVSKAKWDKENEVYRFYDISYRILDSASPKLPQTGTFNMKYAILAGAAVFLLTLTFFLLKRKKKTKKADM